MNIRTRKFIGLILSVVTLGVYILLAMVAGSLFTGMGTIVEIVVFVILGLGWLPLLMAIIVWSSRGQAK